MISSATLDDSGPDTDDAFVDILSPGREYLGLMLVING